MNELTMWEDKNKLGEIKQIFGPNLNDAEFKTLVGIGRATGLNPFLREVWSIKYGNAPASIFIGRDGYRTVARKHPDYKSHVVDAVYSNDKFSVKDQTPNHEYSLLDRGELVGAYCVVFTRSSDRPFFVFVEAKEYRNTKNPVWREKPATMLKKVAEAQCLRMAFPDKFAGTYVDAEEWRTDKTDKSAEEVLTPKEKEVLELLSDDANNDLPSDDIYPLDKLIDDMKSCETVDDLKVTFKAAYQYAQANNPEKVDEIMILKDKIKIQLDAE